MGGRGQKAPGGVKTVSMEKWGRDITIPEAVYEVIDGQKTVVGEIYDDREYDQVPDIRKTTKKQTLEEVDAWRSEDGTYGNEDVTIYIQYDDGNMVDLDDLDGKSYKKSGIIGVSISTPDYEMVWGDEMHKGQRIPMKTWSEDGESGLSNVYSGYKSTKMRKVRKKRMFAYTDDSGKKHKASTTILRQTPWQAW